ncbi:hypothetical protein AU193_10400 [Mycobacterium sp. GA-1285]|nr:hypothetical protein AU193_10400 [Mycobacterium sp. GA-1285]
MRYENERRSDPVDRLDYRASFRLAQWSSTIHRICWVEVLGGKVSIDVNPVCVEASIGGPSIRVGVFQDGEGDGVRETC